MKKILTIIVLLCLCQVADAAWKLNPHTGKLDYYESGSNTDITDWTAHNSYPSACTGTQFVQGIGDTLTCAQPSDVTGNAATATTLADGDKGDFTCTSGTCTLDVSFSSVSLTFVIDGAGSVISTGEKGFLEIPFAFTITGWTIASDQSGSIVVDVWKDTYANFPPTVADTIAGSEKPTLSTAQINQDLSLGTWTTAVSAGDILLFNVDSATTVRRVTISIRGTT